MSSVVVPRKAGVVDPENGGVRQGFRTMQVLAGCRLGVRVNGASKAGVHGSCFPVAAPDQGSLKPPSDFLIRHRPACWPANATGPNQLETARFTSAMLPGPTSDNPGHSKCLSWPAFPFSSVQKLSSLPCCLSLCCVPWYSFDKSTARRDLVIPAPDDPENKRPFWKTERIGGHELSTKCLTPGCSQRSITSCILPAAIIPTSK